MKLSIRDDKVRDAHKEHALSLRKCHVSYSSTFQTCGDDYLSED